MHIQSCDHSCREQVSYLLRLFHIDRFVKDDKFQQPAKKHTHLKKLLLQRFALICAREISSLQNDM